MLSAPSPDNSVHQFQDQTAQSSWSTNTNTSGLADEGNHLSEDTGMAPTGIPVVRSSPTTVPGLLTSLGGRTGPSSAGKNGLSYEMDLSRRMKVVEESLRLQTALGVSHRQKAEKAPESYGLPSSARTPVRDLRRRRNKALHEVKPVTKTEPADIQAMENRVGMAGNVIRATTEIGIDGNPLTSAKNEKLPAKASRARDTEKAMPAARSTGTPDAMTPSHCFRDGFISPDAKRCYEFTAKQCNLRDGDLGGTCGLDGRRHHDIARGTNGIPPHSVAPPLRTSTSKVDCSGSKFKGEDENPENHAAEDKPADEEKPEADEKPSGAAKTEYLVKKRQLLHEVERVLGPDDPFTIQSRRRYQHAVKKEHVERNFTL